MIFDYDLSEKIKMFAKILFLLSIIVFAMMKLLVKLFIIELFAQSNIFKQVYTSFTVTWNFLLTLLSIV